MDIVIVIAIIATVAAAMILLISALRFRLTFGISMHSPGAEKAVTRKLGELYQRYQGYQAALNAAKKDLEATSAYEPLAAIKKAAKRVALWQALSARSYHKMERTARFACRKGFAQEVLLAGVPEWVLPKPKERRVVGA